MARLVAQRRDGRGRRCLRPHGAGGGMRTTLAALLAGVLLASAHLSPPRCFEDEVIVWTGDRHDRCVPLDDIREAAVDLYVEATQQ